MEESGLARADAEERHSIIRVSAESSTLWKDARHLLSLGTAHVLSLAGAFFLFRLLHRYVAASDGGESVLLGVNSGLAIALIAMSAASLWFLMTRDASLGVPMSHGWTRVAGTVSFAAAFTAFLGAFVWPGEYDPRATVLVWTLAILAIQTGEFLARRAFDGLSDDSSAPTPVIIVGSPLTAAAAKRRFEEQGHEFTLTGIVDLAEAASNGQSADGHRRPGELPDLSQVLNGHTKRNGGLMVAVPANEYPRLRPVFDAYPFLEANVRVTLYPSPNGAEADVAPSSQLKSARFDRRKETLKRLFDLILALTSLIIAAPLMVIIAVLIKLDSPGPMFFNQTRVGRRGQLFKMYKFRTMRRDAESLLDGLTDQNEATGYMFKMSNDPRLTRVGRVMRRLSLDELPQLLNVVLGNMGVIGPRPPLPHEVEHYEPLHFQRFETVPGISGLWQVTRGCEISFDEMVQLDLEYIANWSLWQDFTILLRTIPAMLRGQGAY